VLSTVIPQGSSVTIFCSIPPGVTALHLNHAQLKGSTYDHNQQGTQKVTEFSFSIVTDINVGIYHCDYWKHDVWLGCSRPLELVVTGEG
jgi:hypothetical protein